MSRTALSIGRTKDAALYFDHVVPLFLFMDIALEEEFEVLMAMDQKDAVSWFSDKRNKYVKLLPSELKEGTSAFEKFVELNMQNIKTVGLGDSFTGPYGSNVLVSDIIRDNFDRIRQNLDQFLKAVPIPNAALTTSEVVVVDDATNGDEVAVTLTGLRLVNTNDLSIEHLNEFREDKEAMASLRKLRVFAQNEYAGKPLSFIEDDLHSRIYEYEQAAKKWRLEVVHAGLATLFNSKTAIGAMGGTIAAVLAGSPVLATSAAIAGTALEIGKISLSVSKKRFDARSALGDNPVSYITTAKKRLNS